MRKLSILGCWLLLLAASFTVHAQPSAKAYAPEDLQKLDVNGRIRVLNKEYSDLSDGQRLPNDQLEFYLDQIEESNWGFSEIREDMQESMGARPDSQLSRPLPPPLPPPATAFDGYWGPQRVTAIECASIGERARECSTPFNQPRLAEQLSRGACIEGQTWGTRGSLVWVTRGCRALFIEGGRRGRGPGPGGQGGGRGDSFTCGSEDGRRTSCTTPWGGLARLRRQLSSSECIEGRTWGTAPGIVWVNRGCRGLFEEVLGGTVVVEGETVCESLNGGLRICRWNDRIGRPRLLREFSRGACIEGRSWGWDRRGLWVDRGCSGVFGVR